MSTLTYFYLKYKIYSLSSRLHNMYTPNKRSPLVKIHSDYVKDSFAKTVMSILIFVFFNCALQGISINRMLGCFDTSDTFFFKCAVTGISIKLVLV